MSDEKPKAPAQSGEMPAAAPRRRRPRYSGKYPRRYEEKYKEHNPQRYRDAVAKIISSGKTPAGSHRPIMVQEILQALEPHSAEIAVDCTLGFGGHAESMIKAIQPGGRLIGLDADPIQLPRTEQRLRELGLGPETFTAVHANFAGLPQVLARAGVESVDMILADLGVSSMQLDDPSRGFSMKWDGPLDMRLNPQRGQPASAFIETIDPLKLAVIFAENADEPHAAHLATELAGRAIATTKALAREIRRALPRLGKEQQDLAIRRVFQALRIEVNDEFSKLEALLRAAPWCLKSGGRMAVLTFHSGEDRRVKQSFESGFRDGLYSEISREVIRPGAEERRSNPRSSPAKLRWAKRAIATED